MQFCPDRGKMYRKLPIARRYFQHCIYVLLYVCVMDKYYILIILCLYILYYLHYMNVYVCMTYILHKFIFLHRSMHEETERDCKGY